MPQLLVGPDCSLLFYLLADSSVDLEGIKVQYRTLREKAVEKSEEV